MRQGKKGLSIKHTLHFTPEPIRHTLYLISEPINGTARDQYTVKPLESVSKTSASAYLWTVDQALRQNISDKTTSLLPWADKTEVHVRSTVKGVRGIVGSETFIDISTAPVLAQAWRWDLPATVDTITGVWKTLRSFVLVLNLSK
ncbi:hypothetical protein RRG08_032762 [Elysia crispata]|uniref:Uncharacterized protein n=1 Tax=Elysia crispata TaxID=231223 RepID=A0AAE0YPC5_9GAST|nr:hypothetical protein RRG08_032762 [Elysia crispata]